MEQAMNAPGPVARFLRGYGQLTLFLIPIGIATNFVGAQIASLLKLPMYLDSIGTILIGALCGCLPGALVGAVANLINSITTPTLAPYALISIGLGVLAGLLSRIGVFKSLWKTAVSSIGFAIIGGAGGGLITIWLFGGLGSNGGAFIVAALHALGMDLNTAVFVAGIPQDLVDKFVSVIIVYLIIRRIPTRLFVKVPLGRAYLDRTRRKVISIPADDMALEP